MRCASALRCPWLVMGSAPPVDSMTISDQMTPVEMCTDATFDMAMLSSLLPNRRDFTRLTRCGLMTSRVGKKKLPCVQRLAVKVSAGEESIGLAGMVVMVSSQTAELSLRRTAEGGCPHISRGCAHMQCGRSLDPFERALFPHPDVAHDQDHEEDQNLDQAEYAEGLELDRPGKKKNRFHVEDNEEDRDNVVANGVASAGAVDGVNATLVGHELDLAGIRWAYQLGQEQRDRQQAADHCDQDEDGDVILRHGLGLSSSTGAASHPTADGAAVQAWMFCGLIHKCRRALLDRTAEGGCPHTFRAI